MRDQLAPLDAMNSDTSSSSPVSPGNSELSEASANESVPLRIMVSGTPKAVTSIIHSLYALGFAEVGEWSPLQKGRLPGQVVSILTRRAGIE